ncbi:unnamed protein product, partial [Polarella glacialis]
ALVAEEEFHRQPLWDGYVDSSELAAWLREAKPGLVVVDVRDFDFARYGCKISGARHAASKLLLQDMSPLRSALTGDEGRTVVFHCMFSQFRGPKCAQEYARLVRGSGEGSGGGAQQKVLVLRGGFVEFHRAFGEAHDKHLLFEALDDTEKKKDE